jgi:Beta-ketoacyl synthase, N-terminal domain
MPTWDDARELLSGRRAPDAGPLLFKPPQPQLLPPNERRRAPLSVLMALQAAEEAMRRTSVVAAETPAVFASSDAEMGIIHRISSALAEPARVVSPTDFHNSVHNAASGYFGIAARATRSATTLSAFDGSFAAGLREALALLADDAGAVLLVLYDVPPPVPLYEKRPIETACGIAMMLTRAAVPGSVARLSLVETIDPDQHDATKARRGETTLSEPALEALRRGNPAARALPVLAAVARGVETTVTVVTENGSLLGVRVSCL